MFAGTLAALLSNFEKWHTYAPEVLTNLNEAVMKKFLSEKNIIMEMKTTKLNTIISPILNKQYIPQLKFLGEETSEYTEFFYKNA